MIRTKIQRSFVNGPNTQARYGMVWYSSVDLIFLEMARSYLERKVLVVELVQNPLTVVPATTLLFAKG